jgi:CubicO group peptidase (beta-lactamase class C family)
MSTRPADIHLANWRASPHNRWSFHHVRELIPTANVRCDPLSASDLPVENAGLDALDFEDDSRMRRPLKDVLCASWTDALCVLHRGAVVYEWYAPHFDGLEPHILFSVSKSVTGTLAGVLVDLGRLDVNESVATYIPDAAGSAFADCTVQHVLDMQVGLDFAEVYTGENVQFNRYRVATAWNPPAPGEAPGDLRSFLTGIGRNEVPHGHTFQYASPNTDMLGLILESAAGEALPGLLSRYLWQPMGAESDAYVTVDVRGASRAAGGICVRPRDLARFGLLMCNGGRTGGKQVVPGGWVEDCLAAGSREAWRRGSMADLLPHGRYRNQWYQTGNDTGAFFALGIHGQWVYVDPATEVVVVKLSSQPDPVDDAADLTMLRLFSAIALALG